MENSFWRRVRGGSSGARVLSAYLAIVLMVSVAGPGLSVYATEGELPDPPILEEVAVPTEPEVEATESVTEVELTESVPAPEPVIDEIVPAPAEEEVAIASSAAPASALTVGPSCYVPPTGDLKVYKYEDKDEDKKRDSGEDWLKDWKFTVYNASGGKVGDGNTNSSGWLHFDNLPVGVYTVTETLQSGWVNTTALTQTVEVKKDQTAELKFGNVRVKTGDLKVYKYEDKDEDKKRDSGEDWLKDWEFTLYNSSGAKVDDGKTDHDGALRFNDLPVGIYTVTETLQGGWVNTTALTQTVEVKKDHTAELKFGNVRVKTGDLKVYKYEDLDKDGVYDAGEPKLKDWEFTVYNSSGAKVDDGKTDNDGRVRFNHLPIGIYTVTETLQDGWINTTPLTQTVEVKKDHTAELWFGNATVPDVPETGDVKVYKYHDLDQDGVYDDGEPMLENWEFTLTLAPGTVAAGTLEASGVFSETGKTDVLGELTFDALLPDAYLVTETLQTGWTNTTPLVQPVTVVAGQTTEVWFGNVELGDLRVYKYEDLDRDGVYDDGEPMLEDWEFEVTLESPPLEPLDVGASAVMLIDSGLTDEFGEVLFTGLAPNEYTVREILQDGWVNTTPLVQTVNVVSGQTVELWFGNTPEVGDLTIFKYEDLDEDGFYDDGEPMLEDWEFTVTREIPLNGNDQVGPAAVETIGSGLTDEFGELSFIGLDPGEYIVTETLQDGWTNTTPLVQTVTVAYGEPAELWFGNIEEFLPFTELDLAITKVANRATAGEGELITYTLTYWNLGDLAAENFTIVDDFDERYVTVVNASGGTVAGGKITWMLAGPLAKADGMKTITYTVRVIADMPQGTTNVDNVVVIDHPRDENKSNNTDNERVVVRVDDPFLPFTDDPFLPFTGAEYLMLILAAVAAAGVGLALRIQPRRES